MNSSLLIDQLSLDKYYHLQNKREYTKLGSRRRSFQRNPTLTYYKTMNIEIQTFLIVFLSIISFLRARTIFNERDDSIIQHQLEEAHLTAQQHNQQDQKAEKFVNQQPNLINLDDYIDIDNQIFFYQYDLQRNFQKRTKMMGQNTYGVMGKYDNCKEGQIITNDRFTPPYNQQCFEINPFKRDRRPPLLINSQYEPSLRYQLQRLQVQEQIYNPILQRSYEEQQNTLKQLFAYWASQLNKQVRSDDNNEMEEKQADVPRKKVEYKIRNISKKNRRSASQRLSEMTTKRKSYSTSADESLPSIIEQQIMNKEQQLLALKRLQASFIRQTST